MTLQQLRYITMVAEKGTISEAAKELFISQPSLTNAIRELEQEMQVTIFHRTNKGVTITAEGDEFLAYARQILDQVGLMQERYLNVNERNPRFSVSCQHYSFAVNAFVDVIRKFDARKYDFTLRETQTYEIIEDVAKLISEIGILYTSSQNETIIMKLTPNVTDITEIAKAAEAGGADALSLINTLTGMKIDINRRTFAVANKTGGVSGPVVHPIAVRMVYQTAQAVNIPIIGMGGIATPEDAIEMILAGASAVSVGTANFYNPNATIEIIDGIEAYMKKNGFESVKDMVGIVK